MAERTGGVYTGINETAIGWERDGAIVSGAWFTSYNGRSIVVHMALDALVRQFIPVIFGYAFDQLGILRGLCFVDSTNGKALRLNARLGWRVHTVIPDAGRDGDLVVMTIDRAGYLDILNRYGTIQGSRYGWQIKHAGCAGLHEAGGQAGRVTDGALAAADSR